MCACFWNGQIKAFRRNPGLQPQELDLTSAKRYAESLKQQNVLCKGIKVNEEELSQQQLKENFEAIQNYNTKDVNKGYLCSTCEPFLCLLSHLSGCRIVHEYNRVSITYEPWETKNSNHEIVFKSNTSHFWC